MNIHIEQYGPPGWDIKRELVVSVSMLVCFILVFFLIFKIHMLDLVSHSGAWWNPQTQEIEEGLRYRSMMHVMRNTLIFLIPSFIYYGSCIGRHYRSMSVYTMKRVPDAFEIHRRCLVLPAVFMILTAAAAWICAEWGMASYISALPEGAVIDESIPFRFWRMIICLY